MKSYQVQEIRSDEVYRKMMNAPIEKKEDIYRYELMKPFEGKWNSYHCPLKSASPGGYDVVMASDMLGYITPKKIDDTCQDDVSRLSDTAFWNACKSSIENAVDQFIKAGVELPVKEYLFTIMLANPESPYMKLCDNYSGDGGIPGYIFGTLVPSDYTMQRMPVALAHETNHNVRFQFVKWNNNITLGEYMVCEGLAESYAAELYGNDQIGPWITKTDMETLNDYIKPLMKDALTVQGFDTISAYMYGDEIALLRDYIPAGMPYCAGYACGYHLVQYYLKKTGKSIIEATLLPGEEILREVEGFWG